MEKLVMNDWDLEAIIRGSWGSHAVVAEEASIAAMTWRDQREFDFDFSSFEKLEATATVLNELDELYKPFLILQPTPPYEGSTTTTAAATSSLSSSVVDSINGGGGDDVDKPDVMMKPEVEVVADDENSPRASSKPSGRGKRKQKQNIRVLELCVEDVDHDDNLRNMDEWNWRKYGQKSIKGSPYPRSYYKCSSVGGCKARKQVEQSVGFPYKYVVTYIGDHAHPLPARRRSFVPRKLPYFSPCLTIASQQQ